jgi:drug/metabolite transporter (DMT)-like permease
LALVGALLYGALAFGLAYAFAYWSLVGLKAGLLSVVTATVPLLTLLLAAVHRIERFRWRGLAGALLALVGIAIILKEQLTLAVPIPYLVGGVLTAFCIAESTLESPRFSDLTSQGHRESLLASGLDP